MDRKLVVEEGIHYSNCNGIKRTDKKKVSLLESRVWIKINLMKIPLSVSYATIADEAVCNKDSLLDAVSAESFNKLLCFLKNKNVGHRPRKLKVFSRKDVNKFLNNAPDDKYLLMKVVMIMGIAGACRREELVKIIIDDVEDGNAFILVELKEIKRYEIYLTKFGNGYKFLPIENEMRINIFGDIHRENYNDINDGIK
ncbi:hypothetical protein C0J52_03578 [Blattella germanica]|nr:hypothetical protein C0J52_03578 [Blattella germanica]